MCVLRSAHLAHLVGREGVLVDEQVGDAAAKEALQAANKARQWAAGGAEAETRVTLGESVWAMHAKDRMPGAALGCSCTAGSSREVAHAGFQVGAGAEGDVACEVYGPAACGRLGEAVGVCSHTKAAHCQPGGPAAFGLLGVSLEVLRLCP